MIGDSQLAEYLEGDMAPEARQRFEMIAAEDDKLIAQIVAQQRVLHALQVLNYAASEPHHPQADPRLKRAIMELAGGNEPDNARADSPEEVVPNKVQPSVVIAAAVLFLLGLLSVALWYFAPQP
jgi:hypothetical protein